MLNKIKIFKHIKYLFSIIANWLKGIIIFLNKSYKRFDIPKVNNLFLQHIISDEKGLVELFSKNKTALVDGNLIISGKLKIFNILINCEEYNHLWHTDFISGNIYPRKPSILINNRNFIKKGADIIIPWELSRFQFIPTLIQAYLLTKEIKYIKYFEAILDSWILKNQYKIGVNWKTAMDAGIRAINIGLALIFFNNFISMDKKEYYYRIIRAHFDFIADEILKRKDIKRHNHYMIGIVSLIFLNNFFLDQNINKYSEEIERKFKDEILKQFNSDGVNFESANHYHQLVLESVLFGLYFLKAKYNVNDINNRSYNRYFDQKLLDRISSAVKFVNEYMETFTQSPQFGDSDDGRLIIYCDYFNWDKLNHYFISDIYKTLFSEWGIKTTNYPSLYEVSGLGFYFNSNYGICLNNSIDKDPIYRGHSHFDKTSFVLQVKGQPIFIDNGTYCYTSNIKARNQHKKTRAHNVVIIDNLEQAFSRSEGAFSILENIETKICCNKTNESIEFEMSHNGYTRINNLENLTRKIICYDKEIQIKDIVNGNGNHLIEIIFNLNSGITFERNEQTLILSNNIIKLCTLKFESFLEVKSENGFYSRGYNERQKSKRIILSAKINLPCEINTVIALT